MELGDDVERRFQTVLNNVSDGHVIRKPDGLARRHELSVGDERIHPLDERPAQAKSGASGGDSETNFLLLQSNPGNGN